MSKSLYRIEIKKSRGNEKENGNINIKFPYQKINHLQSTINN